MPPEGLIRRLTAILNADVAGYSRLMGEDDDATVRTLTGYREMMTALIKERGGRVVDSPGDNLLAEFSSVGHAVECAVEIQRGLRERNADLPEDRRLEYRIGINLGDVIEEGERIYGDGVNIAARLESLAEPGGICISGSVYNQIRSRLELEYEDLGEKSVKNIKEPVSVYRVLIKPESVTDVTVEKKDYALPEGPSIAVLPFVNMSDDPKQEHFSDGLTENIITGLSCDGRLLVIARNSTLSYKGKSVKVQEVGRELGAQYVVEGSVQKTEDRVRITAQLINGKTGHHVWSDRYDRELKDVFSLQDEITMKIMAAVGIKLVEGQQYGEKYLPPSGSLEVFMKRMKATNYYWRMNREDNILARQELEEAIALDPQYSLPYSWLALTHLLDFWLQCTESPEISFAQASKNIEKALALDDENWHAHYALGHLYLLRKEPVKVISALERAIAINRNANDAYALLGYLFTTTGKPEEGIKLTEKAIRLNPIPPDIYLLWLGIGYYFLGQYEDAVKVYKQVLRHSPNNLFFHINLIAAYSASAREEEARHQAQELLRLDPSFSVDKWAETVDFKDKALTERYIAHLRKAGLKYGVRKDI